MPPLIYVDMDDVMCAYSEAYAHDFRANPEVLPQTVPGFFTSLMPINDAIRSVNELRELFDVYVLTAPSTRNPHCYTEKRLWIEKYFGFPFTNKLIISPNKGLLKGDVLIDDHATGRGQDQFEGELIVFGSAAFPTWAEVMSYLKGPAMQQLGG